MDSEWCSWFAGLCDGEATFMIEKTFCPRLKITLTATDAFVLHHICDVLGVGTVYYHSAERLRANGRNDRDSVCLVISGRTNCSKVVPLLSNRMRSKKAQEFSVWAQAVEKSVALGAWNRGQRALMTTAREQLLHLRRQ